MKIVCLERALLRDHDRPRAHIALILTAAARQRRLSRGRCRGRMAEGGLGSPTRGNNAALGHAPQTVIPWTDLTKALYQSKLNPRYREIAILRQAHRANAPYEIHQHRFIAMSNGITEEELSLILTGDKVQSLSPIENLICQAADEMESHATITDDTFRALNEQLDHRELVELLLIISVYCAVARFLNSARIQIEDDNPLAGESSPTGRH